MPSRRKRQTSIHDQAGLIDTLGIARHRLLEAARPIQPTCDTAREIHLVIDAIDRLVGHLTGG